MIERILVPVGGSELSELALSYCEELAGRLHPEIYLVYIRETNETEQRHVYESYLQTISQTIEETVKTQFAGSPDLTVKIIVLVGNPAIELTGYAEKNDIKLIVMTLHGRSGKTPWAVGSTASRMTQQLHVPVLLVRVGLSDAGHSANELFRKILVLLDGSETGEAAVPYVKELAQQIETEIILLQVISPGQHVRTFGGLDYIKFPDQVVEQMKADADAYLNKVQTQFIHPTIKVSCQYIARHSRQFNEQQLLPF